MPLPFLSEAVAAVGAEGTMSDTIIRHRLRPNVRRLLEQSYAAYAQVCARNHIRAFVAYRPVPAGNGVEFDPPAFREVARMSELAGVELIDLMPAFEDVADRLSLVLSYRDNHTNAAGHRLLSDRLYVELARRLVPGRTAP
jgi:hypothetical protein